MKELDNMEIHKKHTMSEKIFLSMKISGEDRKK